MNGDRYKAGDRVVYTYRDDQRRLQNAPGVVLSVVKDMKTTKKGWVPHEIKTYLVQLDNGHTEKIWPSNLKKEHPVAGRYQPGDRVQFRPPQSSMIWLGTVVEYVDSPSGSHPKLVRVKMDGRGWEIVPAKYLKKDK